MHPNYNELADADPANSLEYQRLFFVPDCDAEREKRGRFQSFIHSISKTKPANSSYFKPVEDMRDKIIQNALESDDKDMKQAVPVDRSRLADSKPVTEAFADMASAHGYEQTAKGFRDNENVMINEALDILQADEKKKITKKIQDGTLNFTPDGGVLMEDDPMTRMLSGY
jgi:hypothetical protein